MNPICQKCQGELEIEDQAALYEALELVQLERGICV